MSALVRFTKKEYAFIDDKFGISKEQLDDYTEDELFDLQDKCSDIEIDAIKEAGNNKLSVDGETAAQIVTRIGNTLCVYEGDEAD